MLKAIIYLFFLFPLLYFIGVIVSAFYSTGGAFAAFLCILYLLITIGIFLFFLRLFQINSNWNDNDVIRRRNIKEKKEANDWGIIDYFDKDL